MADRARSCQESVYIECPEATAAACEPIPINIRRPHRLPRPYVRFSMEMVHQQIKEATAKYPQLQSCAKEIRAPIVESTEGGTHGLS